MLEKLNCYVKRVSVFLIAAALIAGVAGCGPLPSEIHDWYDLDAVRDNLGGSYILMNDLDSATAGYEELASPTANGGKGWQPIGFWNPWDGMDGFRGTFDGQGHEIRDLFINHSPHGFDVGLFGVVDPGGVVQNIGVVNADVTGFRSVGGLVGSNGGTVSNSYSTGNVAGEEDVGGLVGVNGGTLSNSYYNYDEVLINEEHIITMGALFSEDFEEWLDNDKFLDVNQRLSQENSYYLINDIRDFKQLLAFGQDDTLKFRLTNDLDLGDESNFYIPYLAEEFDGNGHKISNLSFDFGFISQVGLFGYLASGGKVSQVGVEEVDITGYSGVGGLVGENSGTVINSYSTGSVTGNDVVGGLVGDNNFGSVSNSYSTGNVTGSTYVGGLVGHNEGGNVNNSYSTGSVTGDWDGGGLVGWNDGTVSNSYSTSNVASEQGAGGLVGWNTDTVSNSYACGRVTGDGNVAGLVGSNLGTVSDSYSRCNVTGDWQVGGLVGWNNGTVSNCYSTGSVTANENEDVGGLLGDNFKGNVSKSFWDIETSGQATSDGGTGKTTAEMQGIATFSGAGWNIVAVASPGTRNPSYIWNIVNGATYPFLSWQP
jgi:hypothetical protein